MKNHVLKFKPSFFDDLKEIRSFFISAIGVRLIVDIYLQKIREEIFNLKNPLIKGVSAGFKDAGFRKIPILNGKFIIFFKMEDLATKNIYHVRATRTNYERLLNK